MSEHFGHKLNQEWIKITNKSLIVNSLAHSTESQLIHSRLPLSEAEAQWTKKPSSIHFISKDKNMGFDFLQGKEVTNFRQNTFEDKILLRSSISAFFFCNSLSWEYKAPTSVCGSNSGQTIVSKIIVFDKLQKQEAWFTSEIKQRNVTSESRFPLSDFLIPGNSATHYNLKRIS